MHLLSRDRLETAVSLSFYAKLRSAKSSIAMRRNVDFLINP